MTSLVRTIGISHPELPVAALKMVATYLRTSSRLPLASNSLHLSRHFHKSISSPQIGIKAVGLFQARQFSTRSVMYQSISNTTQYSQRSIGTKIVTRKAELDCFTDPKFISRASNINIGKSTSTLLAVKAVETQSNTAIQAGSKAASIVKTSGITKAALLSQASNSFSRLLIHVKWPLIRNSSNTTTLDLVSAFISWMVMGNLLWIILGTTTFGLMAMYSIHYFDHLWDSISLFQDNEQDGDDMDDQKKDSSILGYITSSILAYGLGVRIQFQKGSILPELKDGKLRFKNFKIFSAENNNRSESEDDTVGSITKFTANVEAIEVTLSFNKWYEGNGLIYDLEIFGMNGKVYKNQVVENKVPVVKPKKSHLDEALTYSLNRHNDNIHFQYDLQDHDIEELDSVRNAQISKNTFMDSMYQLEHVKIHDSYFEVYNNDSTETPLRISLFSCDLPRLRGDKLLIDFFNANNASGALNDSMFTIHKRKEIDHYSLTKDEGNKIVRFKLDGIDMGSISRANPHLKLNWIVNGKAEIMADIKLPDLSDSEFQLSQEYKRVSNVVSDMFNELVNVTKPTDDKEVDIEGNSATLLKGAIAAIYHTFTKPQHDDNEEVRSEYVLVNVKVKFYDLKASLPKHLPMASSSATPFVSLQDLRQLIGFVNNTNEENASSSTSSNDAEANGSVSRFSRNNPLIIKTTVIEKLSHLYNTEDLSKTAIFDSIVGDIYEDLMKLAKQDEKRIIHEKSSMWSHSLASQLLLLGLGAMV